MPETGADWSRFKVQGILFLIASLAAIIILITDKNLQTDFGFQKPFFVHWFGMLAIAVVSLIGGIVLLATSRRSLGITGTVVSGLLVLFLIGDVETYSQVGFKYASQFATYLFGISRYPGSLYYIPGLYDILVILLLATFASGLLPLIRKKERKSLQQ